MVSCDAGGGTIILGSSASLASSDDGNPSEEDDDDSTDVDNVEELAADHDDVICIMRNPSSQVLSVLPTCQRSKHLWPFQKFDNSREQYMLFDKGLQFGIDLDNFE
ncbi:uncharacterized protein [Bactrocera oleae]|uniref:uncharacterized protein isoform X2 n=1 Tax=Bactrocera oleae TaxID=104688 RepID=UPI00387E831C